MKISKIKSNPNNPRIIKDDKFKKLVKSLTEFPEMMSKRPLVCVTDVDGKIYPLGGNMRLKALQEIGHKEIPDEWVQMADEWTEEQRREFVIKDNVGFGEWDWDDLANNWDNEKLQDWGLDIPDFAVTEAEAVEDDYEIPDEIQTDIVLGDLFEIGEHRLLCGSATNSNDWEKLNIQSGTCCFTSPPYNAGNSAKLTGNKSMSKKGNFYETYDDDSENYEILLQESLSNAITYTDGVCFNVQPLANNKAKLLKWIVENESAFVDILTWDKGQAQPAMAEGVCSSRFEWLCVFNRENNSRHIPLSSWRGTISNVYQAPPQRQNEFSKVHAATFPIHLPSFVIADLMNRSASVVDCFMGTGTTMVAAHQLGRKSYGIELDPKYCQVIVDRMLKLDPTLEVKRNGQPYIQTS